MIDPHDLTVAAAAQALDVSERTVWRYLRAGRLSGRTEGPAGAQRTLIPRAVVEELKEQRVHDPQAERLRQERDRLVGELAAAQADRQELAARVARLQQVLARPRRPPLGTLVAERVLSVLERRRAAARSIER